MYAEGPSTAQIGCTAPETLIAAIATVHPPGEGGAITGAQVFLNALSPTTPLDIRTVVPTLGSGITTDDPIVFTGSTGDQVEALVFDMRSIDGKFLQVDNIEFVSVVGFAHVTGRSEEHTSELQSLMRISYAVFCWIKKNNIHKCTQ